MGAVLRWACAAGLVVAVPSDVAADGGTGSVARPLDDVANEYRIAGNALVAAHEYRDAIGAYEKGYARDPWPLFLYNIGLARRSNGDCRGALESFRQFLDAARDTSPAYREAAEVQVGHAHEHTAELEQVCPRAPIEHRYKIPPYRRPFVLGGVSAGIVAGAVGGVLFWSSHRSSSRAQVAAANGTLAEFAAAVDDAHRQRRWGTGLVGLSAGLIVTTLAVHWLYPRWASELRVDPAGEVVGASLTGRF